MNDLADSEDPEDSGWKGKAKWGALIGVVAVIVIGYAHVSKQSVALDDDLCPRDSESRGHTILLLDTSDPLDSRHRAELQRLVREMQYAGNGPGTECVYIPPREALVVYELTRDVDNLTPKLRVCNPGDNPDDWDWKDELTKGRVFAALKWTAFQEKVEALFPEKNTTEQSESLILENLAVIIPRHAPSARQHSEADARRTRLIVFSDLLQNSANLSHYRTYPGSETLKNGTLPKALKTDLTGVDVSLFRLGRDRYARHQTRDHYYWWTEWVRSANGTICWQQDI